MGIFCCGDRGEHHSWSILVVGPRCCQNLEPSTQPSCWQTYWPRLSYLPWDNTPRASKVFSNNSWTTSLMPYDVLAFAMVYSCPIITSYAWGLQYRKINGKRVFLEIQVPLGPPIIHNYLGEVGDSEQFQSFFHKKKGNLWKTLPLILGFPLKERCQLSLKVTYWAPAMCQARETNTPMLKSLKTSTRFF